LFQNRFYLKDWKTAFPDRGFKVAIVEIACEEGGRCMQSCWFPQAVRITRQPTRYIRTIPTPNWATWHFKLMAWLWATGTEA